MSESRDKRWENVWGYIGEPEYDIDADWPSKNYEWVEFRIEIEYDGMQFYRKFRTTNQDLDDMAIPRVETERWLLDKMVDALDKALVEHAKALP